MVENPPDNAGDTRDTSSIPGKIPRGGNDNSLQYSCLENSMEKETGRLQPLGSQRVKHGCTKLTCTQVRAHVGAHTRMKLCSANSIQELGKLVLANI